MIITSLSPNQRYKFEFDTPFHLKNGTYIVTAILSYDEMLQLGYDLQSLYVEVSGDRNLYTTDLPSLPEWKYIKLQTELDVNDYICIPEKYLVKIPNPYVKEYYSLALGIELDIVDNPMLIDSLCQQFKQYIQYTLGIDPNYAIFEMEKVWLTDEEFEEMKRQKMEHSNKVITYFSETVRLHEEINRLRSKLKAYEDLFKTLTS